MENGQWAQLASKLRSLKVENVEMLSTFFLSIFETSVEMTGGNVFQNVVDSFVVADAGKPIRLVPIVDRFVRQLWSTFLLFYSLNKNVNKLVAVYMHGAVKLKVSKFFRFFKGRFGLSQVTLLYSFY
jgi:hypothetical protein